MRSCDYTSSIFIMKRSSLINVVPIAYGHGEFFIEFLFRALNSGLKIKEIPIVGPKITTQYHLMKKSVLLARHLPN